MDDKLAVVFVTLALIAAGVALVWMGMVNRRRLREMEHRERLAMIERGLVPAPELDPAGFESRAGLPPGPENRSALRSRSAGVMLMGLGFALVLLITVAAGSAETGIGVGGAFVLLGAAFFLNGVLLGRRSGGYYDTPARYPPRVNPGRAEPPGNVAP